MKNKQIQEIKKVMKMIDISKTDTAIQDSIKYIKRVEEILGIENCNENIFSDLEIINSIRLIHKYDYGIKDEDVAVSLLELVERYCNSSIESLQNEI